MPFISNRRFGLLALAAAFALAGGRATAQFIWSNPAGGSWSAAGNWSGGSGPASGGSLTTGLTFGLSSSYTATDDFAGTFNLNSISFANTAGTIVTLASSGGSLNFTGTSPAITVGPGNATVSAPVTFDGLSVSTAVGGSLSFAGTVNGNSTTNNLIVNGSGTGSVTFAGGGTFNQLSLRGASASATGGTLALTFPTDGTNSTSGLQLGAATGQTAQFTASGGAIVNVSENAYIGDAAGSTGTVTVSGAGSTLNVIGGTSNRLAVGNFGSGTLNITGGGAVNAARLFQSRQTGSGPSTILVDGAGSLLHVTTQATFGSAGVGTTTVQNGATLSADSIFIIAANATGNGTVTITGTGSSASVGVAAEVAPAAGGTGLITVQNGGTFNLPNASGALLLGSFATGVTGGTGMVTVKDAGSTFTVAGVTQIATNAGSTGTLSVQTGANFTAAGSVLVGLDGASGATPAANGAINVSGANATFAAASLLVGGSGGTSSGGTGSVTIQNGGAVTVAGQTGIGANPGGVGTLTIQSGGTMTQNGSMFVGATGATGLLPAAQGTVNVSGAGSALMLPGTSSALIFGGGATPGGTGNLNLGAGGAITAQNILFAQNTGSAATAVVDNATLTAGNEFVVAVNGNATLTIQNGGTATTVGALFAGVSAGATGTITVTGAGSTFTATDGAILGGTGSAAGGTGILTITNQGSASFAGGIQLYGGSQANLVAGGAMTTGGLYDGLTGSSVGSVNLAAGTTLTINDDGGSFSGTINGGGAIAKTLTGTQILSGTNTYTGGTTITGGAISVTTDAALGGGPVAVGGFATLVYTALTTSTGRTFALTGGGTISVSAGQTLTLTSATVFGGFLDGAGAVATNGSRLVNMTIQPSVSVTSTSPADVFTHVVNSGIVTVAPGVNFGTATGFNDFKVQGGGTFTVSANSSVNVANFQSYGLVNVNPGTTATTLVTNTGTAPLFFNGGSRTFIGTVNGNGLAQLELNGQTAVVAGGLFVNNGKVTDSSAAGNATIIADFNALVKGAGQYDNPVITRNGGKFQAGNSPGKATFGNFVFGPGGVDNYVFSIDDATGQAGPSANSLGQVSGWGLVASNRLTRSSGATAGSFAWTADASNKLTVALDTLLNPTTPGVDLPGPMADFDPSKPYSWMAVQWAGAYSGPTDAATLDAATSFDTAGFANPVAGSFGWAIDPVGQTLSLNYTPTAVPEPGTLALVAAAALFGAGWRRRRLMPPV